MAEKHETTIRRLFDDVWNKGNLKVIDEICTPDVANNDPINPVRGLDAMKGVVRKYRTAFPDCRFDVDEIASTGDTCFARWRYSGTHQGALEGIAPTGRRVSGTGLVLCHFMGDRMSQMYVNWDALGMMQQLGVVTLPGKAAQAGA